MDIKTIEKSASETLLNKPFELGITTIWYFKKGFKEGAEWRINSVWHEANKEIPMPFRPILVEHDDGKFSVNMVAGNMQSCPMAWSRWAYVDDLLPMERR